MKPSSFSLREALARRASAIPLSAISVRPARFRLAADDEDGDDDGDGLSPASRDDQWQAMLRMVLGDVPDGAEHAPPCHCTLEPIGEDYAFGGLAGLPPAVRLMDGFFPIRDQSKRGACFAFALVSLCEYMLGKTVQLSEQSLFHFTKLVTPGKVDELRDGAFTLDAIHAIEEYGICPLSEWHYNPESWNYVEDPLHEGQGVALQRKLAAAQPYRFRHWRTLSQGSVLQFKQALAAGFPVYTGVLVTSDWEDDEVRRTGVFPCPNLLWGIHVSPPPRGLVEGILTAHGIDTDDGDAEAAIGRVAAKLISDTLQYVASVVFGCDLRILNLNEDADGVDIVALLDKIDTTGHAMCLAGYADAPDYPGGGYFIARNSWGEADWGAESPERPGYALIPYAYIADFGHEGVVMAEFPTDARPPCLPAAPPPPAPPLPAAPLAGQRDCGTSVASAGFSPSAGFRLSTAPLRTSAPLPATPRPVVPPPPAASAPDVAFEAWLAARVSVLSKPARDASGILRAKGTPVLRPDPTRPDEFLKDTPENRTSLRPRFFAEVNGKRNADILAAVREAADDLFDRMRFSVPLEDLRETALALHPDLAPLDSASVRVALLALQDSDENRYALCINRFGMEELRFAEALGNSVRVKE